MEVAWDVLGVSGPSSPAPSQEISNAGFLAVIEALECQLGITDEPSTPTFWATIEERRPGWGVDLITTSGPPHQRQFGGPLGRIVSEQYPFNLTEYLKTYDVKNNVTYKGEGWISIPESGEYTFILHASRPHSGNCFHSMSIAGVELFPPQVVKFDACDGQSVLKARRHRRGRFRAHNGILLLLLALSGQEIPDSRRF